MTQLNFRQLKVVHPVVLNISYISNCQIQHSFDTENLQTATRFEFN